jgi:Zn-dependent oligopeptidase
MSSKPLCPCCLQAYSNAIVAGEVPSPKEVAPSNFQFCGTCAPSDVELALAEKGAKDRSVPPIVWLLTTEAIELETQAILEATQRNLDEIAAVPLDQVSFENCIAKLMTPPNYKTNPSVAACKFLQHCSTDPAIREQASKAGKAFAASRVQGRMRKDVYSRVKAFCDLPPTNLSDYQQHFCKAALEDFERAGLALSDENAQKTQGIAGTRCSCLFRIRQESRSGLYQIVFFTRRVERMWR